MSTPSRGSDQRQVVRAFGSIGSATMASRILGFVRDMLVARTFGAGWVTDAFVVAFRIPNLLRRLLGEGALAAALLPVFTDYRVNRAPEEFRAMLRAVLAAGLLALSLVTGVGITAAPWILRVIAPGFVADPDQAALTLLLTRVMFPYLFLVGLSAIAMGALHTHGRFFAPAFGPALLNLGMIGAMLFLSPRIEPPILALALGVVVGGIAQFTAQLPSLRRCGLLVAPSLDLRHPALRRVVRLLLPAAFGLAAAQVMVFVNTLLASLLPAGSISFLYYADRVMELPAGLFGAALASASLPAMARAAASGDRAGVGTTLTFALGLSFYVTVPATVGLIVLGTPIVRVLFERGEFSPLDTAATARALVCYAIGLVPSSGARIVAQAFYAVHRPGTAVKVGISAIGVNLVAAVLIMGPLGHAGLALATALSSGVHFLTLFWLARARFGGLRVGELLASLRRTLVASCALGAWCAVGLWLWPAGADRLVDVGLLSVVVGGGALVYWLASAALGAPERRALLGLRPGRGGPESTASLDP